MATPNPMFPETVMSNAQETLDLYTMKRREVQMLFAELARMGARELDANHSNAAEDVVPAPHLELTPEVLDDLDRALASLVEKFAIQHVPTFARAAAPFVSEATRDAIHRALDAASTVKPKWTTRYANAADDTAPPADDVPGELTVEEHGSPAFDRRVIRRLISIKGDSLDLRRWLSLVPPVHGMFARSGAEKIVGQLSSANMELNDELLDAFADAMSVWAKDNDPALELSSQGLP